MCGITGILKFYQDEMVDEETIYNMVRLLNHRGPDGQGVYVDRNVGLGHSRLSIIDVEGGHQPIHNENKSIWVVFNGEIFNYIELTRDLKKKGHLFYTHSDTEVIVHLYEEYGDEFVKHLNGQFAIAIWDSNNKKLLLVRDRPGIQPLFYSISNNTIFFGSEIKAILRGKKICPKLSVDSLDELMTFWAPVSGKTIFEGVESLDPGTMLIVHNGQVKHKSYWQWGFPQNGEYYDAPEEDQIEELRDLLIDATKIRLRSDVPVGAYLSGGLDSSSLVSMIRNHTNTSLRTFSIGFDDENLDESSYQNEMVRFLETDHRKILCSLSDVADNFEKTIWHTESPVLRTAPVAMGMLSSFVRENNYKVVLTGEGADEVLGGYDIFKEAKIRKFWSQNPDSSFRALLLKRLYPYLDMGQGKGQAFIRNFFGTAIDQPDLPWFSHMPRWDTTSRCKDFFSDDMKAHLRDGAIERLQKTLPEALEDWNYFNRAQYIESKTLMSGYLLSSQGDRMLMMNSVEGRFPFLDHRLIEFANKLDPRMKMKVLNEKYLLKRAMKGYVPDTILNRYKQPYRSPDIPSFFAGNSPAYVDELMSDSAIRSSGYFDEKRVSLLMKKIRRGHAIGYKDNMAFVGILSTQIWHKKFINEFDENIMSNKN